MGTLPNKLTGAQIAEMHAALLSAFPSRFALEQMVLFRLNKNLNAIAGDWTLEAVVFELLRRAEAEGWRRELMIKAHEHNPGNPMLTVLVERLGGPGQAGRFDPASSGGNIAPGPQEEPTHRVADEPAVPVTGDMLAQVPRAPESPVSPSAPVKLRILLPEELEALITALASCDSLGSAENRNLIRSLLPREVRFNAPASNVLVQDITGLVTASLQYQGGFQQLLRRVRFREGPTYSRDDLDRVVIGFFPHLQTELE